MPGTNSLVWMPPAPVVFQSLIVAHLRYWWGWVLGAATQSSISPPDATVNNRHSDKSSRGLSGASTLLSVIWQLGMSDGLIFNPYQITRSEPPSVAHGYCWVNVRGCNRLEVRASFPDHAHLLHLTTWIVWTFTTQETHSIPPVACRGLWMPGPTQWYWYPENCLWKLIYLLYSRFQNRCQWLPGFAVPFASPFCTTTVYSTHIFTWSFP